MLLLIWVIARFSWGEPGVMRLGGEDRQPTPGTRRGSHHFAFCARLLSSVMGDESVGRMSWAGVGRPALPGFAGLQR